MVKSLLEQLKDGDEQIKSQKPMVLDDVSESQIQGISDGGGRSVDAMVIHQKEKVTLWYKFNDKKQVFEYSNLEDGWDDKSLPDNHNPGERWSKELAFKDNSKIASFKVSYSDV